MNLFRKKKEISLVSREITVDRQDMRRKCGVSDDELLVYVGVGLSFDPSFMRYMKPIEAPNVKFLTSSNTELPFGETIKIPTNETETQNYIAMCDLVVSKTGYGTVSEAVRAMIPMFMLKREGFKEDELIGNKVKELGIGKFISEKSFLDGDWIERLDEVKSLRERFDNLPKRFKEEGVQEIINTMINSNYYRRKI